MRAPKAWSATQCSSDLVGKVPFGKLLDILNPYLPGGSQAAPG